MSKLNVVLDATMLDMFELCEARFDMRFNMNKVSTEKATPLDKGSVVHIGLEEYYRNLKKGSRYQDSVDSMVHAANIALAEDESDLTADEGKHIVNTLIENVEFWRTTDQSFRINEVESSFAYVLFEDEFIRIIMIGKIDLLTCDNLYPNLPYDHKSSERNSEVQRLTNQFCNYTTATDSNYLIVNKVGFQKTLKAEQKFKRIPLSYDSLILNQWKDNVINIVRNKYIPCAVENQWPMNFTSCLKFNRLCEYYEVCNASGLEAKMYKLTANFKQADVWDVSQALKHKKE